jgi:HlyD family secretion protein
VPVSQNGTELIDPQVSLKRNLRIGMTLVGLLVIVLFLMAGFANITGAVIAAGQVSVESKVKKIAHPRGGVIAEIYVKDGDRVKAGDALMRLDSTVSGVNAAVSGEGLDQLMAQRARLEAERDSSSGIRFPAELTKRGDASARVAISEEARMFRLRRQAIQGQKAQLAERINQLEQQIRGYQSQINASNRQAALIQPELEGVRSLWEKKLVTINKVNQLERTAVDLDASVASLNANIAQARGRITEIRQQAIQLDQDSRSQAGAQLGEVMKLLNDQQVRAVGTDDELTKSVIRAPYDGVVDKVAFTTIGGVIPPAQTIMEIVPDADQLTVEAKINPVDIDQISIGQPAKLRFSAFNAQTTPEVDGRLVHVSAETSTDERSGMTYYTVRLDVDQQEVRKLGELKLVPGMPVEAYVQTGERSLLSFITKPLRDQVNRAFRSG